jgi:hypothetical protein
MFPLRVFNVYLFTAAVLSWKFSLPHRYTASPARPVERDATLTVQSLDFPGVATSAECLAICAEGVLFGSDLEAIPDRVRTRWRSGAEYALNVFCPAIGEKLHLCWLRTCLRLDLKAEVPISTTEAFQKAVSRPSV